MFFIIRFADYKRKLPQVTINRIQYVKISFIPNHIAKFLKPEQFDTCIEGVKRPCIVSDKESLSETQVMLKPDLVLKAGQLLKELAFVKKGQALGEKDYSKKKDADDFIALHVAEWNDKVTGIARQNISERKFNKKEILPLASVTCAL